MWISEFSISNYKSINNSGQIKLGRHINVIVGQNNVGKTAVLQALSARFTGTPHKSSSRRRGQALDPISRVKLTIDTSGSTLNNILQNLGKVQIPIDLAWGGTPETQLRHILDAPYIKLSVQLFAAENGGTGWERDRYPSHGLFAPQAARTYLTVASNPAHNSVMVQGRADGESDSLPTNLGPHLGERIYFFSAQRIPASHSAFGSSARLAGDASNLAEVLNVLQANPIAYDRYITTVKSILPQLKWVSAMPAKSGPNLLEVRVWNVDPATSRDDLAIPLSECGTGVGQILAMVYVVTRSTGDVVIIDEPGSFLHPGAVRSLIDTFRRNASHQYVLAAHSPDVVSRAAPDEVILLTYHDEQTIFTSIDGTSVAALRSMLDELGARLSDVYGYDNIIWVEGPTESVCFPILLGLSDSSGSPNGVTFVPLRSTGDLEGKHMLAISDIYRSISNSSSLLPRTVAIVLDGDKSKSVDVKAVERSLGGAVVFLQRQNYESYLIDEAAIEELLDEIDPSWRTAAPEGVTHWIDRRGTDAEFGASGVVPRSAAWLEKVDGARLLASLFQELTGGRQIYRKTLHSPALTRLLVKRESMGELVALAKALVPISVLDA